MPVVEGVYYSQSLLSLKNWEHHPSQLNNLSVGKIFFEIILFFIFLI